MIKIIKYGKKRRIMCCECENVLEFEKEDVVTEQTGMHEYERHVICPVCNERLAIPYKMGE